MTAHTPGPWIVDAEDDSRYIVADHETGAYTLAQLKVGFGLSGTVAECVANARLIAQAPRMLEVLTFLCNLIDNGHEPLPGCDAVNDARAILRAVRGE